VAQEENIIIGYLINSVNLFFVFSRTQKERNRQPLFSYTRNTSPVVFFTFILASTAGPDYQEPAATNDENHLKRHHLVDVFWITKL